jgi:Fe2+ transport system protein FeoA
VRLAEHDGELLHWFYEEGYVPGTKIELRDAQPAAGQFTVKVDGREQSIAEKAAAGLFVRPAGQAACPRNGSVEGFGGNREVPPKRSEV